jgi:hypothetical protein
MRAVLGIQLFVTASARLFVPAAQSVVHPGLQPALPLPQAAPRLAPVVLKTPGEARVPRWVFAPLVAALTAGIIRAATPMISHASVEPVAVVQQYGSSMIAAGTEELTDTQREFLEQRKVLKQQYEDDFDSTYKSVDEVRDKKDVYTTIVVGLIAVAFIAPMIQFFYYTGGD